MTTNENIILEFYTAFQMGDAESMVKHYHNDITFHDPAFGTLQGAEAKNMWRMLLSQAKDLKIDFNQITATKETGKAHWEAIYTFSKTGRKVHNKIDASFHFLEGKIIHHEDHFSFWRWASMALGPVGIMLGFTPIVKNKVRKTALASLKKYMSQGDGY